MDLPQGIIAKSILSPGATLFRRNYMRAATTSAKGMDLVQVLPKLALPKLQNAPAAPHLWNKLKSTTLCNTRTKLASDLQHHLYLCYRSVCVQRTAHSLDPAGCSR